MVRCLIQVENVTPLLNSISALEEVRIYMPIIHMLWFPLYRFIHSIPMVIRWYARVVIKGWDIGIASMKVGEKALLTCKPDYAYGKQQVGPIPADSTLQFEVELVNVSEGSKVRLFIKLVFLIWVGSC